MQRLRDPLPAEDYQKVRHNTDWPDHILRLMTTAAAVAWIRPSTVCDPACGDASILSAAHRLRPFANAVLGDLSAPQMKQMRVPFAFKGYTGDAMETLSKAGRVNLTVLTEVLEHVEDPEAILRAARGVSSELVVSSPIDEQMGVGNHEHVWSWSVDSYRTMLQRAGWFPHALQRIDFYDVRYPYRFQIWSCR